MQNPEIPIPDVLQTRIVYKSHYMEVQEDLLKIPHHEPQHIYTFIKTAPEATVVIAETTSGELVINKEYRHPVKQWLYSLPGGCVDPGESPIEAARRELLEETGYTAREFHHIGSAYPFPGCATLRIHYVLAIEAKCTHPTAHEPFELIQVQVQPLDFLQEEIRQGALIDGTLCAALYFRDLFFRR
jgi:ADP-ribose pyrophosphatase